MSGGTLGTPIGMLPMHYLRLSLTRGRFSALDLQPVTEKVEGDWKDGGLDYCQQGGWKMTT